MPPAARTLAVAAACTVLVILPVTMVVANKSAPILLGLGAALSNAAALACGRSSVLLQRYADLLRTGTGLLLGLLAAAALLSVVWTIDAAMTWRGIIEALPELIFGWALAAAWPVVIRKGNVALLAAGVMLATALLTFEALGGMPLHHLAGSRGEAYDLKRSAVTIVLLAWPAIAFCLSRGERGWALGLAAAGAVAGFFSHSSASVVAIVCGATIYGAARLAPRFALAALAAALSCLLVLTPWAGTLMNTAMSAKARVLLSEQHAGHRIAIWQAFEEHIRDRVFVGHGFDTSFRVANQVEHHVSGSDAVIDNIHPHNVLLQTWVEFGLLGAAGVSMAFAYVVTRLHRLAARERASRLAFLASAAVVALVGLTAWAPWWLAVIAVCLVCFKALSDHDFLDRPTDQVTPAP